MKKLVAYEELREFKRCYEIRSGLEVSMKYLARADVFVWTSHGKYIGGFVQSNCTQSRLIQLYVSATNRAELITGMGALSDYSEISCLWFAMRIRQKSLFHFVAVSGIMWRATLCKEPNLLIGIYGKEPGLSCVLPQSFSLIHRDHVGFVDTFLYNTHKSQCLHNMFWIVRQGVDLSAFIEYCNPKRTLFNIGTIS